MGWASVSPVGLPSLYPLTPGDYHEYFGDSVDLEAMVYLMLVCVRCPNKLLIFDRPTR